MKNILFYIIMFTIFILVAFFGLGPVIFADGTTSERVITLIIVLLIYVLLASTFLYFMKKKKKVKYRK
jgi:LPXTG-motif cell wall-anchored protein